MQRQIKHHRTSRGQQRIDQRNPACHLCQHAGQFHRLAEQETVAEVTNHRVGHNIDQQAAERAGRDQPDVSRAAGFAGVKLENAVGKEPADKPDDELEQKVVTA